MLDTTGLSTLEDLYSHLPADVRFQGELNIPHGKSEYEIVDYFRARGRKTLMRTPIFWERESIIITAR